MKPNFALGLTKDGITLWQRGASGWLRVGAVSPETEHMDAQMRDLAKIAASLAPDGVQTKLVVPDDQMLFCDVDISAKNPDMQAHEIRAQLAGRTPYPVEELDFDWTVSGSTAHVAVVARETVIEAEDFASLYGLNPVSVVGAAESGRFTQEPFFGTTRSAREILGDPARLERDRDILRETGIATLPDPELVEQHPAPTASKTAEAPPATDPAPTKAVAKDIAAKEAKPKPSKADPAQKDSPKGPSRDDDSSGKGKAASTPTKAEPPKPKAADPRSEPAPSGISAPAVAASKADMASADGSSVAFRSRRAASTPSDKTPPAPSPGTKQPTKPGKDLLGSLRSKLGSGQSLSKLAFGSLGKSLGSQKPSQPVKAALSDTTPKPSTAASKTATTPKAQAAAPAQASGGAARQAGKGKPGAAPPVKEPLPRRKDPLDTLSARAASSGKQTEVERMTIFGARNRAEPEAPPARRALLVLGGVGMLLLAVAVWVFYMTVTGPEPAPEVAEDLNPVIEPAPLDTELAAPLEDTLLQDEIEAALGLEDAAQQLPIDAPEPELAQEAETTPQPTTQIAGNDVNAGRIAGLRSSSLLPPQEAVPLPDAPDAPSPFGAEPLPPLREEVETAALAPEVTSATDPVDTAPDALALSESALPEGEAALDIAVTEGTPPVTPPTRPEGLAPELEAAALPEPEPEPEPESVPEPAPEAAQVPDATPEPLDESTLVIDVTEGSPAVTPPERPAGLAPDLPEPEPAPEPALSPDPEGETPPEQTEESSSADQAGLNAPPPGGVALTALRPQTRPDELAEAVATAAAAPVLDASDLAVAESLRPGARPGQFAALVQRTLRAAQTQAPASTAAPEAAIQTARAAVQPAPPIPASASVAREATQARAINLRQINLIGVMGTSSSRRALVRLSNGRVVAVRVGESLDGGQVTAIGENELRYNRRGRDVVLRIAS